MDELVTIAGAADLCGIKASTLRAYDSRREPKKCPFPEPDKNDEVRCGNRIIRYWRTSVILKWNVDRLKPKHPRVDPECGQLWIDRAARISGTLPPNGWRRIVKINTVTRVDGINLIDVVGWWQRQRDDGHTWTDMSDVRHSAVRSDMWHRRMTFLESAV